MDIKQRLIEVSDEKYKKFSSSLIPNCNNILGVRIPLLRKFAKELSKSDYKTFLLQNEFEFQEEIMLQGMLIGFVFENDFEVIKNYVLKINNWALCDTFCAGLKFVKNKKEEAWEFIQPYKKSKKEFEVRFFYVILLMHFIDSDYIDKILKSIDEFNHNAYYAKMAVAWALQACFVKFEDKTFKYLKKSSLDDWTYNKAIQKMIESYKVAPDMKNTLKSLKR